jgi:glycine oxidase
MSQQITADYIIVGMGLAGSSIAVQLINAGKTVAVIDAPAENRSSRVAAGLFNPVTGNNMVKTWLADQLFPYLHEFYCGLENTTGTKFFFPTPLYRPFVSIEEQNEWMGRSADEHYSPVIDRIYTDPAFDYVRNPFGGLMLKQCGYVNTVGFMNAVRSMVQHRGVYREARFDYSALRIHDDHVHYEGITASRIVFCEGYQSVLNPWFKDVPIRGLKGEVIHIKSVIQKDVILNRGVYIVPANEPSQFKVGSTYNWKDKTMEISLPGRLEIEEKLKDLVQLPYEVIGQEWGIRPTTADRKPVLGAHPKFSRLVIFNGLGTKGVSLAPYFSQALFQWLEVGSPLKKEVDVSRFKLLY